MFLRGKKISDILVGIAVKDRALLSRLNDRWLVAQLHNTIGSFLTRMLFFSLLSICVDLRSGDNARPADPILFFIFYFHIWRDGNFNLAGESRVPRRGLVYKYLRILLN